MPDSSRAAETIAVEAAAAASAASGTRGAKMLMLVQQEGGAQTRLMAPNAKGMISAASEYVISALREVKFPSKAKKLTQWPSLWIILCAFSPLGYVHLFKDGNLLYFLYSA